MGELVMEYAGEVIRRPVAGQDTKIHACPYMYMFTYVSRHRHVLQISVNSSIHSKGWGCISLPWTKTTTLMQPTKGTLPAT